ncbi:MAG: hypothetical protein LBD56_00500 [Endomicrobium sp.]|nr:hypothetical protein [Endomicrobium sp.]
MKMSIHHFPVGDSTNLENVSLFEWKENTDTMRMVKAKKIFPMNLRKK